MPDREKVIKGLEHCKRESEHIDDNPCNGCPYYELKECQQMMADALALLKGQETEISRISNEYLDLAKKASKEVIQNDKEERPDQLYG